MLGWRFRQIISKIHKSDSLSIIDCTLSMALFKRILKSCSSVRSLYFSRCKIVGDVNLQWSPCLANDIECALLQELKISNCDFQGKQGSLESFLKELYP
ncbi:unnamed protein product [Moneuplotes crassus]|uniref:Uncharacterized protein n=1 Tax=Euplotes crassus TaxID=5936 RepID=A0AAD1UHM8_EUPCR|nr:unnamed protein product [Moneuplotes crassus]